MAIGDFGKILMQNLRGVFSDPNMRPVLFGTGANLMRTPQVGQSGWDVAADSLTRGMETLAVLRERDRVRAEEAARRQLEERRYQETLGMKKEELGFEKSKAAAYTEMTGAQAAESRARTVGMPEAQAAALAESAAQREQYLSAATENRAQAALAGRTDPNLRAAGQIGEGVQSIQALTDEYVAGGMDPVKAKAQAVKDYQKMKKGSPSQQVAKAVNDRMEFLDPFIFTKPAAEQDALRQRVLPQIMEEYKIGQPAEGAARPGQVVPTARTPQPGAQFLGKTGNFMHNGQVKKGKVTGLSNGMLVIALEDGTILTKDVSKMAPGQ